MAKGRGSAIVARMVLCLLVVVFQSEVGEAATYVVGEESGWTFNVSGWEEGKEFTSDDVLVFNYQKEAHKVVAVNDEGYDGCTVNPDDAPVYTSGNDQITLVKGSNNFICGFSGHCGAGMKIRIDAS